MRNEPRGVGVYTALSVLAVMIIGGIISVRSSDTFVSDPAPTRTQSATPTGAFEKHADTVTHNTDTIHATATSTVEIELVQ